METWKQYISPQMDSSIYPKKMVNVLKRLEQHIRKYSKEHKAYHSIVTNEIEVIEKHEKAKATYKINQKNLKQLKM